jgi:integrase
LHDFSAVYSGSMASLWKHPNSNYWTACFTDIHGRRCKRTTGVEVVPKLKAVKPADLRKRAQAIADEYEAASRAQRSANKVRSVLMDLHTMVSGETLVTMTVNKAIQEWLARRKSETEPSTMKFYEHVTGKLVKFLGLRADKDICLVTRQDIFDYRASRSLDVQPVTVNHEVKTLRMFFTAAKREGWVIENPTEGVESVKASKEIVKVERRPFTMAEVASLLDLADPEWKSMILCGLYTGQRLGDLSRLTWANVDLPAGVIRLTTGKTGKRMVIPMAGPLREGLATRRAAMPKALLVHPTLSALIAKSSGPVSNQFATLLRQAGLRVKKEKSGGSMRVAHDLSFHCFRHTAVTFLKAAGIPASVVMELVGHDTVQMSEHYSHVGEEALLAAVNSLPQLGGSTVPPEPAPPTDVPS